MEMCGHMLTEEQWKSSPTWDTRVYSIDNIPLGPRPVTTTFPIYLGDFSRQMTISNKNDADSNVSWRLKL